VIAEGTTGVDEYGSTPTERITFIASTISNHLARAACAVHRAGVDDLERRLGARPGWCPACGIRL
jgi:hypothetical protein